MSSLYACYIKESLNKDIIESEEGFATFSYSGDGVYVEDIYVRPEFRKSGLGQQMVNQIAEIAKSKGYKKMYGSVSLTSNTPDKNLHIQYANGMRLFAANNQMVYMVKDI